MVVHANSGITKGKLKDIDFPDDANIGGIIRGDQGIIAMGDTQIQEGDKVVVFTMPSAIKKVEKIFK